MEGENGENKSRISPTKLSWTLLEKLRIRRKSTPTDKAAKRAAKKLDLEEKPPPPLIRRQHNGLLFDDFYEGKVRVSQIFDEINKLTCNFYCNSNEWKKAIREQRSKGLFQNPLKKRIF